MATIELDGERFNFDHERPIDISIPLRFNGPQPNAYGVAAAVSTPYQAGDLIGDTRQGGSINFEEYTVIPHCTGTHTECVGHITHERISIRDCLTDIFIPALLISVIADDASTSGETYSIAFVEGDRVITKRSLAAQIGRFSGVQIKALIVRTLPNNDGKLTRKYGDFVPPFFTREAMKCIVDHGVEHLLVDMPSIDRIFDEGKLLNHRTFWNVRMESFEVSADTRRKSTITELIYVPSSVEDGRYLLNLQIAPFVSDAAPSRPVLFGSQL